MVNLNEVLTKTMELKYAIKQLLGISIYKEYSDLSCLSIDYEDAEQLF